MRARPPRLAAASTRSTSRPSASGGAGGGGAREAPAHHQDLDLPILDGGGVGPGVGEAAEAGELAHHLLDHRLRQGDPGEHLVVVEAPGEEPVGGPEEVVLGAPEDVLALGGEAVVAGGPAGGDVGHPVHPHQAVGAVPAAAGGAPGPVVLHRAPEDRVARGEEGRGEGLALERRHRRPVEVDGDPRAIG